MILTKEDISGIKNVIEDLVVTRFEQMDQNFGQVVRTIEKMDQNFGQVVRSIEMLEQTFNRRLIAIELRLDSIEYKLSQIAVFIPYENAFLIPPTKKPRD